MNTQFNIESFLDLSKYATETRIARRKSNNDLEISNTNEFYTPFEIVKQMSDMVSEEKWNDTNTDFLEPSMGNGQFVIYIIYNKIIHGSTWEQALSHTWGVELMEDNVKETHDRVISMLKKMNIKFDEHVAREIMKHNLVQSDFFKWDFENWKPTND